MWHLPWEEWEKIPSMKKMRISKEHAQMRYTICTSRSFWYLQWKYAGEPWSPAKQFNSARELLDYLFLF